MIFRNLFFTVSCLMGWIAPAPAEASVPVNQNRIPVHYQLMDQQMFHKIIVGHTIVGVTGQSKSLYLLYFGKDGTCDMWKKNQVYPGTWWIEKDEQGRDFMRAFWPTYAAAQKQPNTEATSIWYYVDTEQSDTLIVATENERSPVLLIPGRSFPQQ